MKHQSECVAFCKYFTKFNSFGAKFVSIIIHHVRVCGKISPAIEKGLYFKRILYFYKKVYILNLNYKLSILSFN
jgi:hypothetical protein